MNSTTAAAPGAVAGAQGVFACRHPKMAGAIPQPRRKTQAIRASSKLSAGTRPARRSCVAVHASQATYGADWATPQDAYLTLVRACWPASLLAVGHARSNGFERTVPNPVCAPALPSSTHPPTPQGLAHCFEKNDDGKLSEVFVIEPISANSLECMAAGGRTCFKHVFSLLLSDALTRDKSALPAEFAAARYCEEFEIRCDSCARTWLRPHAMDNLL